MTISQEAIEAAHAEINKSWRNDRWEWDAPKSAAERALRAALPFLPIAGEGKVKELEWLNDVAVSDALGFPYSVYQEHGMDTVQWAVNVVDGHFPSEEAAKAAAQSDYETRILSALVWGGE